MSAPLLFAARVAGFYPHGVHSGATQHCAKCMPFTQ